MNQQDVIALKFHKAKEELQNHYQELNKYLRSLQQTYLMAMQQPTQYHLPNPQMLQNQINQLVNAYAAASQKLAFAPQPPAIICREILDTFIKQTKANADFINEITKKYKELEERQKQILQQINNVQIKQKGTKSIIDNLNENNIDEFINQLLDWDNAQIIVKLNKTEEAILLLCDALKKNSSNSQKIEDICEGIMAFISMTLLSPIAVSQLSDVISQVILSPAVSEEATPAIIDVYDALQVPVCLQ
ncbi:hypothetical protein EHI8A_215590 [Entamoeba histolytica HM-1:IMSS-B]|uniref:Uncharacterized protein n=5 Tax=Entamoeba histolytica TaxID=5759 RepID=C4M842_ENTH1|nr:hypothetical protein EHI_108630 [Entamoeba histolytica HM-1:IMSS]EMD48821.1 Hypothetical protein EHI5A_200710 [Entamoeba histolytica KU27]EMH73580.1 hypothetical protein EHI8A_215590 [Entamoeba histolytica HM-1:IMSS-B]EMS17806.1 hypothetical protein KM1_097250 [Entamoeba histolytica HM-3:IMSS]GAT97719.1 hypothetical protein CL6EHI_108630 [Entamoeba histolytica]EAL45946.1 hypothetical protein EHI_108630 [Entamoeba histolytica HM-1:IMSS]|eukprot:XP_651334.1 hypothetical protein EHI_108630 [Entamoeba histolytica HM-1:IMSS]